MKGAAKQANFLLPEDLAEELRGTVPKGEHSKVVAEALRRELKRLRLIKAREIRFGAWRDEDHPELCEDTDRHIRNLQESTKARRAG